MTPEPRQQPRVAAVMASYNRRETTLRCLRALISSSTEAAIEVFLLDDASTDGTAAAVDGLGLWAHVTKGTGTLFWAGGMCLAEREAMRHDPDYLLWLNDDTLMDPGSLEIMLDLSRTHGDSSIIVGATRDPETGGLTYGGRRRTASWHPQRFRRLPISTEPQIADSMNGNLVLIPRSVRLAVGPIDGLFPHAYADDDYGLRATERGVSVVQAPGTLASCPRSPSGGLPRNRWNQRQTPKGLPIRAQARYFRRHGGSSWPLVLAAQQFRWLVGGTAVEFDPQDTGHRTE